MHKDFFVLKLLRFLFIKLVNTEKGLCFRFQLIGEKMSRFQIFQKKTFISHYYLVNMP